VTVVIPTRDRWSLLSTYALPSALGQEGVELEVVVADDGSVDGTSARLDDLADQQLRYVRHDEPRGAAAARNAGIADARGEWIAFLDDDDLWSPSKLRAQLESMGSARWGYTGAFVVDERLRPIDTLPLADPSSLPDALRHGNVVAAGSSSVLVRAELVRSVGGFDENLWFGYDWDLWRRLAEAGSAAVCPDLLVATLEHSRRSRLRDRRLLLKESDELVRRGGGDRDDRRSAAEWIANDQHRGGKRVAASLLYLRAAVLFRSPGNLPPAVGALFGERGMRAAARLLSTLGRGSHLDLERHPPAVAPEWLRAFPPPSSI
jgi:glycosyltransferase involved in cell wall biosynthesis